MGPDLRSLAYANSMPQHLPDMAYGADERQRLDLYLPDRDRAPLFFFIHGGGWRGGDKAEYRPLAEVLVKFGYAVALPNHRLAPTHRHPAQIEDVAAALGFLLRGSRESGIETTGICLAGHSSGGHLAALLALHPEHLKRNGAERRQIAGVISICGVFDLTCYRGSEDGYLAAAFGNDAELYRDASPLFHATATAPPFFLAYAERDYPGAGEQAAAMEAKLAACGVPARNLRVAGRDHVTILTGVRSMLDPLAVNLALFLRSIR